MKLIFKGLYEDLTLVSVNKKYKGSQMFRAHSHYLVGLFMRDAMDPEGIDTPFSKEVKVTIYTISKKDIDNDLKMIQDCLQKAEVLSDDSIIRRLRKDIVSRDTEIKGKDSFYIEIEALSKQDYKDLERIKNKYFK